MLRHRLPPRHSDGGFTLVELLVTVVILGIIAVPLTSVVITFFLNSSTTTARLTESHDEQIANAYWQQDVASLGVRGDYDTGASTYPLQPSVDNSGGVLPCAAAALPSGTVVVAMAWNQYAISGTPTKIGVAYIAQPAGTRYTLLRVHCTENAGVDSTATLAHNLTSVPTLSCPGNCFASTPAAMSLELDVSDPSGKGQPYSVTLTGQRRQT